MPTTFNQYVHYPGSGETGPYAPVWNPITRRVERNVNAIPLFRSINTAPVVPRAPQVQIAPQPITTLPSIFANQRFQDTATQPTLSGQPETGISPISFPRSTRVAKETESLFADLDALKANINESLKSFRTAYGDFLPASKAATEQEAAVLGRPFTGEFAGDQAASRAELLKALEDVGNRQIVEMVRPLLAKGRLVGVPSSDLNRAALNIAAGIKTQAALTGAEQKRRDLEYLTNLQTLLRGSRSAQGRQYLQDVLLPGQVDLDTFGRLLSVIQPTSQLDLLNQISGLMAPGGYVGETLSGLQAARLQDLSRLQGYDQMAQNWNQFQIGVPLARAQTAAENQLAASNFARAQADQNWTDAFNRVYGQPQQRVTG